MSAEKIENMKEQSLEGALKRLDEIVTALSADGGDLDGALKLYEEGVGLVRVCNEKLGDAERRIKAVRINSDGEITEENFIGEEGSDL